MELYELYLSEAMSVADVDLSKIKKDGHDYVVDTQINGVPYKIMFYPGNLKSTKKLGAEKTWVIQFRVSEKTGPLRKQSPATEYSYKVQNFNNGMEFKLMPVVMGYIVGFIKKFSPDAFAFASDVNEKSRVSLYRAVSKRYANELKRMGYRALTDDEMADDQNDRPDFVPFVFVKNNQQAAEDQS